MGNTIGDLILGPGVVFAFRGMDIVGQIPLGGVIEVTGLDFVSSIKHLGREHSLASTYRLAFKGKELGITR